jgi:hypothetical protein
MRPTRPLHALLLALAATGCASWNDRYPSNWDSAANLFGFQTPGVRDWPSRDVPDLPPMTSDPIPDRRPPPAEPGLGWPPLLPAQDAVVAEDQPAASCAPPCEMQQRADAADPRLAVRRGLPPSR